MVSACVLNRPTVNVMRFQLPGKPERRALYCGNRELRTQVRLG